MLPGPTGEVALRVTYPVAAPETDE
jgi:hypothetical protein